MIGYRCSLPIVLICCAVCIAVQRRLTRPIEARPPDVTPPSTCCCKPERCTWQDTHHVQAALQHTLIVAPDKRAWCCKKKVPSCDGKYLTALVDINVSLTYVYSNLDCAFQKTVAQIQDLDFHVISPGPIYHAYVKLLLESSPPGEEVRFEADPWPTMTRVEPGHQEDHAHRIFQAGLGGGMAAFTQHRAEISRFAIREDVTLQQFVHELLEATSKAMDDLPHHAHRTVKAPWDATYYNCQHYVRDMVGILCPAALETYISMLQQDAAELTVVNTTSGWLLSRAASYLSHTQTPQRYFSLFNMHPKKILADFTKLGGSITGKEKIKSMEVYWEPAVWGKAITTKSARMADYGHRYLAMKAAENQQVFSDESGRDPADDVQ